MRRRHHSKNPELAAALARAGLTNQRLAERAAIHPITVSRLLNQRQLPSPETAAKIAAALDSTPRDLGLTDDHMEVDK